MPGKKTLFQRVLVRPGATLVAQPGGAAPVRLLRPFDLFYVFDRKTIKAADWLLLGGSRNGPATGWLSADKCIAWKQTIVVQFTNPAGRELSLLFRDQAAISRYLGDPSDLSALRARAERRALLPNDTAVAIEPQLEVDKQKAFYLLPILGFEMVTHGAREVQALRVAVVAKAEPPPPPLAKPFRTAIVFVMDTTISMRPYIENTREAIRLIYDKIHNSALSNNISFGLVAYRNSIEKTPGLEYLTRVFVPLKVDQNPDAVLDAVSGVQEAVVSSHEIRDDLYSGIKIALEDKEINWQPFDARYIIFFTDSGPLPSSDPWSKHLEPVTLNQDAASRNISIVGLHLMTGGLNQPIYPTVIPAMKLLCRGFSSDKTSRYFQIPKGTPAAFSQVIQQLITTMVSSLQTASRNDKIQVQDNGDEMTSKVLIDTLAMQLAYLGRQENERAPDVIEGWIADRSLENTSRQAVNVCILITKNELSTLQKVLESITFQGEQTRDASPQFFDRIRIALARVARDPDRLSESDQIANADFKTLGEAMGEMLQDLPYRSEIQEITSDDWARKSRADQREILDRLDSKVRYFDRIYAMPERWTALDPAADDGDKVFPMPLAFLP
jgi:hypothetical protein